MIDKSYKLPFSQRTAIWRHIQDLPLQTKGAKRDPIQPWRHFRTSCHSNSRFHTCAHPVELRWRAEDRWVIRYSSRAAGRERVAVATDSAWRRNSFVAVT